MNKQRIGIDALLVSIVAVDENHKVRCAYRHLCALVVAGRCADASLGITIDGQTCYVEHTAPNTFIRFALAPYAEGERVAHKLVGIKATDTVTEGDAGKIDKIMEWANEHPKANIVLTGYADKETGNAGVNKRIAKQRANAVKKALVEKGIAEDRLKIEVKGDTEQPFANNDDNRAVIAFGEE